MPLCLLKFHLRLVFRMKKCREIIVVADCCVYFSFFFVSNVYAFLSLFTVMNMMKPHKKETHGHPALAKAPNMAQLCHQCFCCYSALFCCFCFFLFFFSALMRFLNDCCQRRRHCFVYVRCCCYIFFLLSALLVVFVIHIISNNCCLLGLTANTVNELQ